MGNRWGEVEVINPRSSPYRNIEPDGTGRYKYIPSVGRFLRLSISFNGQNSENGGNFTVLERTAIELLPEIQKVPPPEIEVRTYVDRVIEHFFQSNRLFEILARYGQANTLGFTNGSSWGNYPGSVVVGELKKRGYLFDDTFRH